MKLNYIQLPVKAHYFFFMAAMGPILPFLPVYGKQLGISSVVMGSITAVLPILFLIAKSCFGLLIDHFFRWRKSIFVILLATTSACYVFMYFLPTLPGPIMINHDFQNISCKTAFTSCTLQGTELASNFSCKEGKRTVCHWKCDDGVNSSSPMFFKANEGAARFTPNDTCFLDLAKKPVCQTPGHCNVTCNDFTEDNCLYTSLTFWAFVLLMSLGNIGFNVSNSISDAICFDVLGEDGQMAYGRQRVWGAIGFGLTALLAGYAVDWWSGGALTKTYTPAFILIFIFTVIDLFCCLKLELPPASESTSIVKDFYGLLKSKPMIIFLGFATLAGILDSIIIYFLFWYLEDLATATGYMREIKSIEGLIVAAETLGGEVIFFSLSGKILKKFGYGYSFVFCFACYAVRLGAISLAPTPWWVLAVELLMQGPTYALCYTTIVAYASSVAPPGTSATVQGIVAGMDDGFGFAVGSLLGGILYEKAGGVTTLRILATLAGFCSLTYLILHELYLKHVTPVSDIYRKADGKPPDDVQMECTVEDT